MAAPPAKKAAAAPARAPANAPAMATAQPSSDGTYRPLWIAMGVVAFSAVTLPATIILFFGMMPSLVAFVVDRTDQKYATFCVGSLNFCGVFPYLLEVWTGDHTPQQAFQILSNAFKLLVIFGMAGLGWTLFALIPPLVSAIMVMVAQRRVEQLKEIQQSLVAEWGPEVAEPPKPQAPAKSEPAKRRRR